MQLRPEISKTQISWYISASLRSQDRYAWRTDETEDWKQRYTKLYSTKGLILPKDAKDASRQSRISFMSNEQPYKSLLLNMETPPSLTPSENRASLRSTLSIMQAQSDDYFSCDTKTDNLGGHETKLLEMVRARNRELKEEYQEKTLNLPREDTEDDDEETLSDACIHGLSMRITERSMSRSRVSRMSTRRDMDIPSILAFTTNLSPPPKTHLEIPAFQKIAAPQIEELPRWSIRRSICPVCSQKWKDKSSIINVKNSGLKRNTSAELPSVIAPARLRTSMAIGYVPRPTLASVDEEVGLPPGGLRNSRTGTWQLSRARRFRIPKPQLPYTEAVAPVSSTAPATRKDLDQRVSKFLNDSKDDLSFM